MTFYCSKGNPEFGFVKNRVYPVLSVQKMGKDNWYAVKVTFQMTDRQRTLYANSRYRNVLETDEIRLHNGNPLKYIRGTLQGYEEATEENA